MGSKGELVDHMGKSPNPIPLWEHTPTRRRQRYRQTKNTQREVHETILRKAMLCGRSVYWEGKICGDREVATGPPR